VDRVVMGAEESRTAPMMHQNLRYAIEYRHTQADD